MSNELTVDLRDKIAVPYTIIQNRAPIVDLSQDLRPRFYSTYIDLGFPIRAEGENISGDSRTVSKYTNDRYDQVRTVGMGFTINDQGAFIQSSGEGIVEVTFYGTGLTMVCRVDSGRDWRYVVDGGAESLDIFPSWGSTFSVGRKYNPNQDFEIVSGLPLGLHTIRMRNATGNSPQITGFKVIQETSQILVPAGIGKIGDMQVTRSTPTYVDYNTGFDQEFGTNQGNGGVAALYLKPDGTVGKNVRWSPASAQFLGAASHVNEMEVRNHHWREFGHGSGGAGGSGALQDFTLLSTTERARHFTLNDNTTSLNVETCSLQTTSSVNYLRGPIVAGNNFIIKFYGSGIDLYLGNDPASAGYQITMDGAIIATGTGALSGSGWVKIASGMEVRSHTLIFERTDGAGNTIRLGRIRTYVPKTPDIPVGTGLMSKYLIAENRNNNFGTFRAADGMMNKPAPRFGIGSAPSATSNWTAVSSFASYSDATALQTTTIGDYFEWYEFCDAFSIRFDNDGDAQFQISVDGDTDLSPYSTTFTQAGGNTWTDTTGTYTGATGANAGIGVNGLTLGWHKIRVTKTAGGSNLGLLSFEAGVPTAWPIESSYRFTKNNVVLPHTAISDEVVVLDDYEVPKIKAFNNFESGHLIGETFYEAFEGTVLSFKLEKPATIEVTYVFIFDETIAASSVEFSIFMNGAEGGRNGAVVNPSSDDETMTIVKTFELGKGHHTAQLYGRCAGGGQVRTISATHHAFLKELA
jgi:hypothetical protein